MHVLAEYMILSAQSLVVGILLALLLQAAAEHVLMCEHEQLLRKHRQYKVWPPWVRAVFIIGNSNLYTKIIFWAIFLGMFLCGQYIWRSLSILEVLISLLLQQK
jgi:hypothetical protein